MIVLIILLLSSLGYSLKAKDRRSHDYSLLFALLMLILIAGRIEFLTL